jgi:hypothetical protein
MDRFATGGTDSLTGKRLFFIQNLGNLVLTVILRYCEGGLYIKINNSPIVGLTRLFDADHICMYSSSGVIDSDDIRAAAGRE